MTQANHTLESLSTAVTDLARRLERIERKNAPNHSSGWTNYETWAVSLWLDNDVEQYRKIQGHAETDLAFFEGDKEAAAHSFATWLQKEIEDKIPSYLKGLYADLLNGALSAVNWAEIATNWLASIDLPPPSVPDSQCSVMPEGGIRCNSKPTSKYMVQATPEIIEIISRSVIDEEGLTLPGEMLERKQYEDVDAFLKLAGAKWHKGKKRHLFKSEAAREKIKSLLTTGELLNEKKLYQAFYTPESIATELARLADIASGMSCLEPSAGAGAIALAAQAAGAVVTCCELNPDAVKALETHGFTPITSDFLALSPPDYPAFDRVLMNPPFTENQDIKHVLHAFQFLKPGGKLYAIMSPGFTTGDNKTRSNFRAFLADHGRIVQDLPEGTFKESGTNVRTVIVEVTREGAAQ